MEVLMFKKIWNWLSDNPNPNTFRTYTPGQKIKESGMIWTAWKEVKAADKRRIGR